MAEEQETILYPLGSIVKLKNEKGKYLIVGRGVVSSDKKIWDYALVEYPFGLVSSFDCIFAAHGHVDDILFQGYEDELGKEAADIIIGIRDGSIEKEEFQERIDRLQCLSREQT